MKVIEDWCHRAEIKLNASKTEFISIGKIRIIEASINNEVIKANDKLKYLGIMLDGKLLFKSHLMYLKTKIEKLVLRIKKIGWLNDTKSYNRSV